MDPLVTSALIGGGTSLLGGAMSALTGGKSASDQAYDNMKMQRVFAKNGVRWKVADAKKAGVHPLAALGANTVSYIPQSVGDTRGSDYGITQAGQNIARAVSAKQTAPERALEQAQIRLLNAQAQNLETKNLPIPAMPDNPLNYTTQTSQGSEYDQFPDHASSSMGMGPKIAPFHKWTITQDGVLPRVFSKATEEALENDLPAKLKYYGRFAADSIWHAGMGIADMLRKTKNDKYWQYVENLKPNLPGLDRKDIGWNPFTQTYYILPQKLNKYRAIRNNPKLLNIPRTLKKSH